MKKYEGVVQDDDGNIITNATVTVKDYVGGANATIYAADALGSNINGFTNNSDGTFEFYAKDGRYNIEISKPGITTKVITNVLIHHNSDVVSVKGYGAAGDGSTDDTAAIQAAITANYDKTLYFPAGTYKVTSTLTVADSIRFLGDGRDATFISWTSTTLDVISVASATAVHFEGIKFSGPASATSGAMILLAHSASGVNYFSSFTRCMFSGGYDCIRTVSAAAWAIENCYFTSWVRRAVTVQSVNTPDAGDSSIYGNCVFANGIANSVAIYQVSSGGLKVIGNKFNGLGAHAYQMQLASAVATSNLIFADNSVENHTVDAMKFDTDGGGATFSQVTITGNCFALTPYMIDMSTATAFLSRVVITGNTFALNGTATYGINMGAVDKYVISANSIVNAGAGTPTGVLLGASCTEGQLGPNNYDGLTTNVNDSSTSKAKVYFNDTQVLANSFQFPATQVASTDANCLDDYEEATAASPLTLTFATAGDLSVAYTRQVTQYIKIGRQVTVWFNIVTSTFTHTTASGNLQLTGLPFTVATITDYNFVGSMGWSGLNLQAGYSFVGPQTSSGGTVLIFYMSGDNVAGGNITTTEATTGAGIVLRGSITYIASA